MLLFIGIALGVGITWLVCSRRPKPLPESDKPLVSAEVSEVLGVLQSAVILVGPHDEVLQATDRAVALGVTQAAHVTHASLLATVRKARRENAPTALEMDLGRGGLPGAIWDVRVIPLNDGVVLVLAEDMGAQLRMEQTRRDFVANISHELKTPIGAISLLSETVAEAADDPAAVRRFAMRMSTEADRLIRLVTQIIELSRLQSDDPMLDAQVVDVEDVVIEATDRFRDLAFRKNVTLAMTGRADLHVWGDHGQLAEAVANLVHNAVSYSESGARVAITVMGPPESNEVAIAVSDNGIGINEADQARIFERFYRVDYGRSRDHGGTGLGLSIVKHIAATHGGSVTVWSKLGQGSTFTLRLPRYIEGKTSQ